MERSQHWSMEGSRPAPLRIDRIERDLAAMWKTATTRTGGTAVSRACSSTLAILCDADEGDDARTRVQEISRRHPTRALVLELRPGAAEPLEATAGALCHLRPDGGGLICGEVIQVTARPEAQDRLPSVVRSLAVGGLPLTLLAPTAALCAGPAFRGIAADADIVIVESRYASDLLDPSGEGAGNRGGEGDPEKVRDLAWSTGADLRRALSAAAGNPAVASVLDSPRAVRLEHAPGPVPASTALLAGWLAARLELEPVDGKTRKTGSTGEDPTTIPTQRGDQLVPLSFVAGKPGVDALAVEGASGTASGTVEARVGAGSRFAVVTFPGGCVPVALRPRTPADRVIREMHHHEPNPAYRASRPKARRIAQALEV